MIKLESLLEVINIMDKILLRHAHTRETIFYGEFSVLYESGEIEDYIVVLVNPVDSELTVEVLKIDELGKEYE